MKSLKIKENKYISYIVIAVLLCLVPILPQFGFRSSIVTLVAGVLIYAVAGVGLDLLIGHSGLVSLGTAGFMGLGAYLSAYLIVDLKFPFFAAFLIATLAPVTLGLIVGLISLKVEGLYLGIATLCVSEILRKSFEELTWFTNSFQGKSARHPELIPNMGALNETGTYIFIVLVLLAVMILTHNIVNSYMGRAMLSMRGSEVAAQAMGVNLLIYRLKVFSLATFLAALAGVLYMHFVKFAYPSTWNLAFSLNILALVVIGGLRSSKGALLGSFIVFGLSDIVIKNIPVIKDINGFPYMVNGVLIILIILFYPQGLIHLFDDIKNKFFKKKGAA